MVGILYYRHSSRWVSPTVGILRSDSFCSPLVLFLVTPQVTLGERLGQEMFPVLSKVKATS